MNNSPDNGNQEEEPPSVEEEAGVARGRGKPLTNGQREAILQALLSRVETETGVLPHGAVTAVAKQHGVTRPTVSRLWRRAKDSQAANGVMVVAHRKANCGRKKKDYSRNLAQLAAAPANERNTLRAAAIHAGLPTTSLYRILKEDRGVVKHIVAVKSVLTEANKQARIQKLQRDIK